MEGSKKGIGTIQVIIQVISMRNKENVPKTRDRNGKLKKES